MIQHLENGTEQCDRFHVNTNGTIDVGLMQINSVHLKNGVSLSDLVDCHKNVDIAYALYKKQGRISIIPLDIELVNLVADHALLQQISSKYEGKVVSRKDILSLAQLLKKRGDLKSIIHLQRKYIELAGEWWLFLLVLLLLSAEWAIRKRSGM